MVSGLSFHLIGLIDTIFMAQIGEVELGAVGNATLFYYTVVLSLAGLATAAQIIIGRRNGEENYTEIGNILRQTILLLMVIGFGAWLLLRFASVFIIDEIYVSNAVSEATLSYLKVRSFGIFPALINFSFIAFYVGTTNTRALAIGSPMMAITNIVFDYLLIFGIGPFPEMGIEGAALASVLAEIVGMLFFFVYFFLYNDHRKFNFNFGFSISKTLLQSIIRTGSPLMFQMLLSMGGWFVFFTIIEQLGERELAVSHIIRAIYLMISIPLVAWADASNTLVSNLIGQRKVHMIMPTIGKIAKILLGVNVIYILLLNAFPTETIALFTDNESLISDTIPALRVISFSTTFFAIGMLLYRSLAGAGKTALSMRIELVTICFYLGFSFALVEWFDPSIAIVWCTEFFYFGLLGGLSYYFLRYSKKAFLEL